MQGGPKKNNTETNQNYTDTNDIYGTNVNASLSIYNLHNNICNNHVPVWTLNK